MTVGLCCVFRSFGSRQGSVRAGLPPHPRRNGGYLGMLARMDPGSLRSGARSPAFGGGRAIRGFRFAQPTAILFIPSGDVSRNPAAILFIPSGDVSRNPAAILFIPSGDVSRNPAAILFIPSGDVSGTLRLFYASPPGICRAPAAICMNPTKGDVSRTHDYCMNPPSWDSYNSRFWLSGLVRRGRRGGLRGRLRVRRYLFRRPGRIRVDRRRRL